MQQIIRKCKKMAGQNTFLNEFGRDRDKLWKKFDNGTFIVLQIMVFDPKIF